MNKSVKSIGLNNLLDLDELKTMDRYVIIYGTGKIGIECLYILTEKKIIIDFFCDDDKANWGKMIGEVKIIPPPHLKELDKGICLIITSNYEQRTYERFLNLNDIIIYEFKINNINLELEKLILKYDIYKCLPKAENSIKASKLIIDLFQSIPDSKIIAIRGGGQHTEQLLSVLEEKNIKKIKYIIDIKAENQNTEKEVLDEYSDIKVISTSEIRNNNIDVIIISSYKHSRNMEVELYNLNENYEIINLYEYFSLHGLTFIEPFYFKVDYKDIFIDKKRYKYMKNPLYKQLYLERLIADYICIRDFINAEKCIEEYIGYNYEKTKIISLFKKELEILLDNIKLIIKNRKHKDVVINWIDHFSPEQIESMEYLKSISDKGIYFENAFTVMPWTSTTLATVLTGGYAIDNKLYKINKYNSHNAGMLKFLDDVNYDFIYIGSKFKSFRKNHTTTTFSNNLMCSTYYQWDALNILTINEKPCCIIIHNLAETHTPYVSGDLESFYTNTFNNEEWNVIGKFQMSQSEQYFDKQLEWYDEYRGLECVNIYLSDHGNRSYKKDDFEPEYLDSRIHVLLFLNYKGVFQRKINDLFSHSNFLKLIQYIIKQDIEFNSLLSKYILIQSLDAYSKSTVDLITKHMDYEHMQNELIQRRGVRTLVDKYTKSITGEELYFILPDEKTNHINNVNYQKRISELRKLAGNKFINIYNDDFFIETRRIYDMLDISFADNIEFI